jgi:hypothetical protein
VWIGSIDREMQRGSEYISRNDTQEEGIGGFALQDQIVTCNIPHLNVNRKNVYVSKRDDKWQGLLS